MKRVAEIQRALLPPTLPDIPGIDVAASYKTAARAGGDYYDFFDLGDGRWGLLIADVSGHGTPAAVVMAMLRTILHATCYQCATPSKLLSHANRQLCDQYDRFSGTFVTAFYGILDPAERTLHYSCAGHNPPLLVDRAVNVSELNDAHSLPLAVELESTFPEAQVRLAPGDTLLLYTDGITEAVNEAGTMYGRQRLLSCVREDVPNAQHIIDCVTHKLMGFTRNLPQNDDQTLLALRIR
jgi:sigma-B regulation protein RsbU (phosphoserine phosphatase)